MKTVVRYQGGATKTELQNLILNIENTLSSNEMEAWEAREFNDVIIEYKRQIECIDEMQEILDEM